MPINASGLTSDTSPVNAVSRPMSVKTTGIMQRRPPLTTCSRAPRSPASGGCPAQSVASGKESSPRRNTEPFVAQRLLRVNHAQAREFLQDCRDGDRRLKPGQRRGQADVDSAPEREMLVRAARNVEPLGLRKPGGVTIGGRGPPSARMCVPSHGAAESRSEE